MRIEILGWEKFNSRKDVKAPSWFRFGHDLFEDPQFFDFTHTEICAWIYILCQASKKSCGTVAVNANHLERIGRVRPKDFNGALEKLIAIGCIAVDGVQAEPLPEPDRFLFQRVEARNKVKTAVRNGTLVRPSKCGECGAAAGRIDAHHPDYNKPLEVEWLCPSCHGKKHTKINNEKVRHGYDSDAGATQHNKTLHNITLLPDSARAEPRRAFDFEAIYKKYPRKDGKGGGLKICKAQVKTPEDFAALSHAVDRYAEHCKREISDPKFIRHFSTFMASWRDWLEPDAGTAPALREEEPEWKRLVREQEARDAASGV